MIAPWQYWSSFSIDLTCCCFQKPIFDRSSSERESPVECRVQRFSSVLNCLHDSPHFVIVALVSSATPRASNSWSGIFSRVTSARSTSFIRSRRVAILSGASLICFRSPARRRTPCKAGPTIPTTLAVTLKGSAILFNKIDKINRTNGYRDQGSLSAQVQILARGLKVTWCIATIGGLSYLTHRRDWVVQSLLNLSIQGIIFISGSIFDFGLFFYYLGSIIDGLFRLNLTRFICQVHAWGNLEQVNNMNHARFEGAKQLL